MTIVVDFKCICLWGNSESREFTCAHNHKKAAGEKSLQIERKKKSIYLVYSMN